MEINFSKVDDFDELYNIVKRLPDDTVLYSALEFLRSGHLIYELEDNVENTLEVSIKIKDSYALGEVEYLGVIREQLGSNIDDDFEILTLKDRKGKYIFGYD